MAESLESYTFIPRAGTKIVQTPTTIKDSYGELIANLYEQAKKERFDNNPNFRLQSKNGELIGSTTQDVILLDELLEPFNLKTPTPRDLGNKDLLKMVEDKYYVDSTALVLRSTKDSYDKRINDLAESLAEHVDMNRVEKEPALITGLKVEPFAKEEDYRFLFVPGTNFNVVYDDRLLEKWRGYKFDEVDEIGFPKNLDKKNGNRSWYTRSDGLSGFLLGRDLYLDSSWDQFDDSYEDGRVVLFSGEASAPNFTSLLESQKRSELLDRLRDTRNYLETLEKEVSSESQ